MSCKIAGRNACTLAGRNASVVDGQDAKNKCGFVDDCENHDLLDDCDNGYCHDEHNDP